MIGCGPGFFPARFGGAFNALNDQFGLGMEKAEILELIDIYRYHAPDIQPYPGIPELVKKLSADYKLGLITDGPKRMQRTKFESLGLGEYFSALIFTDELGAGCGKPSKVPFETVANKLGASADKCVYIADNPSKDFLAPNQLGWLSVQYRRPVQVHADLAAPPQGQPQIVVTTDEELLKILE